MRARVASSASWEGTLGGDWKKPEVLLLGTLDILKDSERRVIAVQ